MVNTQYLAWKHVLAFGTTFEAIFNSIDLPFSETRCLGSLAYE